MCQKIFEVYPYDGKTQVTVCDGKVTTVVVSFQNTKNNILLELVKSILEAEEYLINPAGTGGCKNAGLGVGIGAGATATEALGYKVWRGPYRIGKRNIFWVEWPGTTPYGRITLNGAWCRGSKQLGNQNIGLNKILKKVKLLIING